MRAIRAKTFGGEAALGAERALEPALADAERASQRADREPAAARLDPARRFARPARSAPRSRRARAARPRPAARAPRGSGASREPRPSSARARAEHVRRVGRAIGQQLGALAEQRAEPAGRDAHGQRLDRLVALDEERARLRAEELRAQSPARRRERDDPVDPAVGKDAHRLRGPARGRSRRRSRSTNGARRRSAGATSSTPWRAYR